MPFLHYAFTFSHPDSLTDHSNHPNPALFCKRSFLSALAPWVAMDTRDISTYMLRLLYQHSPGTVMYATKLAPSNRANGKFQEVERKYYGDGIQREQQQQQQQQQDVATTTTTKATPAADPNHHQHNNIRTVHPSFFYNHLANLTDLNLSSWLSMRDADFAALDHPSFKLLQSVKFPPIAAHVTAASFSNLATSLPDLRHLEVVRFTPSRWNMDNINNNGASFTQSISRFKNLRSLRLSICSTLTDQDLSHLSRMMSLTSLCLEHLPKVTARGIAASVASVEQLQCLHIGHLVDVGDEGFAAIADSLGEQLLELSLATASLSLRCFVQGLEQFRQLRKLHVPIVLRDDTLATAAGSADGVAQNNNNNDGGGAAESANSLHQVRAAESADTARVQPWVLRLFAAISQHLSHSLVLLTFPVLTLMPHNVMTDDATAMLGACTRLEQLNFPATRQDRLGIGASTSNVSNNNYHHNVHQGVHVAASTTALTHRHFKFLRALSTAGEASLCCNLRLLNLAHCAITDSVLGAIGAVASSSKGTLATSLEELHLSSNQHLTDDGLLALHPLRSLKVLDLQMNLQMTSKVFPAVAHGKYAETLMTLNLRGCGANLKYVFEDAVALKKCLVLRLLDVTHCDPWTWLKYEDDPASAGAQRMKESMRAPGREKDLIFIF